MTPESRLEEIIGHLGAVIIQQAACDDEIIMGHVHAAKDEALKLYRELKNQVTA